MIKKKLVIFMPSIEIGGVEKNLYLISNFLAKKITDVSLITTNYDKKNNFKKVKIIAPKIFFLKNKYRIIKYLLCLFELIKKISLDKKITVLSFQANIYCIIICKIFNVKIIVRSNASPSGWSGNSIRKIFFKSVFRLANCIIVNSYDFKNEFKNKFNVKAECIYNPLNKNEIIKNSKKKINFSFFKNFKYLKIINVARFLDQKDHITLLKAMKLIKNKLKFRLLLIGEGKNKEKIMNYINKNNLNNNIKVLDYKKNPFKYMRLGNIFVLSSIYEGLPNVLLEAICLKKFIISSNCPTGPAEILNNGKGGLLFKVQDHHDLAKKIIFYSKNKLKLRKKINYAYNKLDRFNYCYNLNKYLKTVLNN
jgi:glycosyltransferase involved in cell wall biosynthesis